MALLLLGNMRSVSVRPRTLRSLERKRGKSSDGAGPPEGAELDGGTIGIVAVLSITVAVLAVTLPRLLGTVAGVGGGRVGGARLGLLGIISLLGVGGTVGLAG